MMAGEGFELWLRNLTSGPVSFEIVGKHFIEHLIYGEVKGSRQGILNQAKMRAPLFSILTCRMANE